MTGLEMKKFCEGAAKISRLSDAVNSFPSTSYRCDSKTFLIIIVDKIFVQCQFHLHVCEMSKIDKYID